jgi:hypothetical protein
MIQQSILAVGNLAMMYVSMGFKLPARTKRFLQEYQIVGAFFAFAYINATLKNTFMSLLLTSAILYFLVEDYIMQDQKKKISRLL